MAYDDHPVVRGIRAAAPLAPDLKEKLKEWKTLNPEEVRTICEAIGAPERTSMTPVLNGLCDHQNGSMVNIQCSRMLVKPIVIDNKLLCITVYFDEEGDDRAKYNVHSNVQLRME
jgi:hypothetical protein